MVSVLVPCYNHEKYIEDCLKSLIAQDYQDIELIVFDDCSSDNSYNIILKWKSELVRRFRKVVIHRNERNLGVVKNLNQMICIAEGEYIKDIASDDMLLSNAISSLVIAAETHNADIYFSNVALMPEKTKYEEINLNEFPKVYNEKPIDGKKLTGCICANNYICAPGTFIPMKTFKKYGLYDEGYCLEDFEFWLRVSVTGYLKYIDSVTALYRQNDNSLSRFDMSKQSKNRHKRFCMDKISIFFRYEEYASKEQKELFFNSELDSSIGTNDIETMNQVIRIMRERGLRISTYNRFRIPAVYLRLYPILKGVKKVSKNITQ